MTNKLYVGNVPVDTTEEALRRHFSTCGGVADVELLSERKSGKPRGLACVTMTSPAFTAAALAKLDGVAFEGSPLRVSETPIRADGRAVATVRILQQFRERANMTYDLDCSGVPMTLRMFPTEDEHWRFEARSTDVGDAVVVTGSGATRRDALGALVRAWNENAIATAARPLDGDGLFAAMLDVRAV